jgi:hypothetical protein
MQLPAIPFTLYGSTVKATTKGKSFSLNLDRGTKGDIAVVAALSEGLDFLFRIWHIFILVLLICS